MLLYLAQGAHTQFLVHISNYTTKSVGWWGGGCNCTIEALYKGNYHIQMFYFNDKIYPPFWLHLCREYFKCQLVQDFQFLYRAKKKTAGALPVVVPKTWEICQESTSLRSIRRWTKVVPSHFYNGLILYSISIFINYLITI